MIWALIEKLLIFFDSLKLKPENSNLNKVASEPGFPCIHTRLGKWGSRRGVLILEGFFFDIMAQGIRVCRLVQGITVCLWNLNREKHNITWHNIPYKKSWKLDVLLLCYLNRKHQKLFRRWNVCLLDLQKFCFHKHCFVNKSAYKAHIHTCTYTEHITVKDVV